MGLSPRPSGNLTSRRGQLPTVFPEGLHSGDMAHLVENGEQLVHGQPSYDEVLDDSLGRTPIGLQTHTSKCAHVEGGVGGTCMCVCVCV